MTMGQLAKGLGAAYKTLQKSIKELNHKQLSGYMLTGKITVDGHELSGDDLLINLVFDGDKARRLPCPSPPPPLPWRKELKP